jgi:hypothetical protein
MPGHDPERASTVDRFDGEYDVQLAQVTRAGVRALKCESNQGRGSPGPGTSGSIVIRVGNY